jgi:hypothetical protein
MSGQVWAEKLSGIPKIKKDVVKSLARRKKLQLLDYINEKRENSVRHG